MTILYGNSSAELYSHFRTGLFSLVDGRYVAADDRYKIMVSDEFLKLNDLHVGDSIYIAIFSGQRESEVLGLRWDDIYWETNSIIIRQQLQIVPNTKPAQYQLVPPKENKQRRIILAQSAMQI